MTLAPNDSPTRFLPTLQRFPLASFDSSATKVFKECPRKFFYRMVCGRANPEGEWEAVFAWGTSIHKLLEVLYRTDGDIAEAIKVARPLWKPPTHRNFIFQNLQRWMTTAFTLEKFYIDEQKSKQIVVKAIEQPWMLQFPDGHAIGGRYDQLIEWNGRTWIRDWKTTSKQFMWFGQNLKPNDQGIRYLWATSCLHYGMEPDGMPTRIIDGIIFHAIYNAKTVGPELRSFPITWSRDDVRSWMEGQKWWHKAITSCQEQDIWPMAEANCNFCDYKKVCTLPSDGAKENMLKLNYLLKPWDHTLTDQKEHKE